MPGHTHEDIDQMFSRFSTHLEREDAPTIPELFQHLTKAYTPNPDCRLMTSMWDFRDIIDKEIAAISGHSRPHQFTAKLVSGKVQLKAKLWPDPEEPEVDIPVNRFIPQFPKCTSVKEWKINELDSRIVEHKIALKSVEEDLEKWAETPMDKVSFTTFWTKFLVDEERQPGKPAWRLSHLKHHMPPLDEKSVINDETRASLEKLSRKNKAPIQIVVKGKPGNRKRKLQKADVQRSCPKKARK
ncbi:uncharacterized protein LOC118432704 [Branchiostoma floridae]|uniref:Uncharacterized protein LOC118432704 n=1 Tax=Branchiostoma floridae TaxID=7739 RepID=A0A9J7MFC4_BRAFL|nr:uncharacterized protein LOC118432704 [Branchiostoma floridae]